MTSSRRPTPSSKAYYGYAHHHAQVWANDQESAIVESLKKEGDTVAKGDILFTVETDKSVMEVESFEADAAQDRSCARRQRQLRSPVGFLGRTG